MLLCVHRVRHAAATTRVTTLLESRLDWTCRVDTRARAPVFSWSARDPFVAAAILIVYGGPGDARAIVSRLDADVAACVRAALLLDDSHERERDADARRGGTDLTTNLVSSMLNRSLLAECVARLPPFVVSSSSAFTYQHALVGVRGAGAALPFECVLAHPHLDSYVRALVTTRVLASVFARHAGVTSSSNLFEAAIAATGHVALRECLTTLYNVLATTPLTGFYEYAARGFAERVRERAHLCPDHSAYDACIDALVVELARVPELLRRDHVRKRIQAQMITLTFVERLASLDAEAARMDAAHRPTSAALLRVHTSGVRVRASCLQATDIEATLALAHGRAGLLPGLHCAVVRDDDDTFIVAASRKQLTRWTLLVEPSLSTIRAGLVRARTANWHVASACVVAARRALVDAHTCNKADVRIDDGELDVYATKACVTACIARADKLVGVYAGAAMPPGVLELALMPAPDALVVRVDVVARRPWFISLSDWATAFMETPTKRRRASDDASSSSSSSIVVTENAFDDNDVDDDIRAEADALTGASSSSTTTAATATTRRVQFRAAGTTYEAALVFDGAPASASAYTSKRGVPVDGVLARLVDTILDDAAHTLVERRAALECVRMVRRDETIRTSVRRVPIRTRRTIAVPANARTLEDLFPLGPSSLLPSHVHVSPLVLDSRAAFAPDLRACIVNVLLASNMRFPRTMLAALAPDAGPLLDEALANFFFTTARFTRAINDEPTSYCCHGILHTMEIVCKMVDLVF